MVLIIQTTIPQNTAYMNGTVNGTDTVFVVDSIIDDTIICYCEDAQSQAVVINFYDSSDTLLDTYTDTLTSPIYTFIYDRTEEDVARVKYLHDNYPTLTEEEKAEFLTDLKGALNESDFSRLQTNFTILAILDDAELDVGGVSSIPTNAEFDIIRANLSTIQETGLILADTPIVPFAPYNTYDKWNDIEKLLFDNFDIRTTRFKYFGPELQMREGNSNTIFLLDRYKADAKLLITDIAVQGLVTENKTIIGALNEIYALGLEIL